MKRIVEFVRYLTLTFLLSQSVIAAPLQNSKEIATIETSMGVIKVELFRSKAPATVDNFVQYANSNYYDETIFHRVISNFMIQGGGFDKTFAKKPTNAPIVNEAQPFVPNNRGTISMARTSNPNSATSQFFINVKNNRFLNKTTGNAGYAVFGKVVEGMDIADQIANVKTGTKNHMSDVPEKDVIIKSIRVKPVPVTAKKPEKK